MARPPKAVRNAELYERTFVTGEISNAEAAAAYGLSAVRVREIISNEHRRRTGSRRRPPLPRRHPNAQAQAERDAEIYRRTVITRELTQQEAADAFGLCIGLLGAILTREHQCRNPGTKRPAVPGQRRSYSNRPSADAQARNSEIRRRVSAGDINQQEAAHLYDLSPSASANSYAAQANRQRDHETAALLLAALLLACSSHHAATPEPETSPSGAGHPSQGQRVALGVPDMAGTHPLDQSVLGSALSHRAGALGTLSSNDGTPAQSAIGGTDWARQMILSA